MTWYKNIFWQFLPAFSVRVIKKLIFCSGFLTRFLAGWTTLSEKKFWLSSNSQCTVCNSGLPMGLNHWSPLEVLWPIVFSAQLRVDLKLRVFITFSLYSGFLNFVQVWENSTASILKCTLGLLLLFLFLFFFFFLTWDHWKISLRLYWLYWLYLIIWGL